MPDVAAFVVLSTFPDAETAARIARTLVEERLAACVNLVATVRSIYRWQGEINDDAESLAVIKTTAERYPALAARIAQLHPYHVPEIVALPLAEGHPPYLAWLAGQVDEEEAAQPAVADGDAAQADAAQADAAQADAAQADAAQADAAQADAAQADVAQAEVAQAEVAQADVAQAEVARAATASADDVQTIAARRDAAADET
ncbi:MAG: divalent-cation tolerance protein CutA [Deltaproteobacteria bacterium]|nr:MAG: divalent-cation tolerance protein CutA [Deltaproteobacteria bacterium]